MAEQGGETRTGNGNGGGGTKFGSCCTELKEALAGEDFDPLMTVGDDGVLYVAVGIVEVEDDEQSLVDHPMFHCPFCGTKLQSPDEVKAKVGQEPAGNS